MRSALVVTSVTRRSTRRRLVADAFRVVLPFVVVVCGCSRLLPKGGGPPTADGARAAPRSTRNEAAVYAAVLDSLYVSPQTRTVVLADRTADLSGAGRTTAWWLRRPSALRTATFADFRAKNASPHALPDVARLDARVVRLGERERRQLEAAGPSAWRDFFARYPTTPGVVELSRAGFDADSSQAFVFVRRTCGIACGERTSVLVRRGADGGWRVAERHLLGREQRAVAGEVAPRKGGSTPKAKGKAKPKPKP
jgi:hypothetical protein